MAPIGVAKEFMGARGIQAVRAMMARFPWRSDISEGTACNGAEPAIVTVAKDQNGQTVMEQVVVVGKTGGAIVTYEINDGHPDPHAERALHSICIP